MQKKLFNKDVPLTSLTSEELDRFAWEAICSWPSKAGVNVIHEGLDYSEMTKWFLWDKVGRAIRKEVDPKGFTEEIKKFNFKNVQRKGSTQGDTSSLSKHEGWFSTLGMHLRMNFLKYFQNSKIIYVPKLTKHLKNAVDVLTVRQSIYTITRPADSTGFSGAYGIFGSSKAPLPNFEFSENLFKGILRGLRSFGVELLEEDARHLHQLILRQSKELKLMELQIKRLRPDAILVHSDNHHPVIGSVLIGRREGIPSIMLQHGLDCEHYYLDEAYALAVAVWGKNRMDRYHRDSKWKPQYMEVIGNPDFDSCHLPEQIDASSSYWLWVTRPHTSERCYAPSRRTQEGLEILKVLLEALSRNPNKHLVIKPHPDDYWNVYLDYIALSNCADRVEIRDSDIHDLIPEGSVVISEDSTAGMEAMFYGKIVVHAHFSETKPTMGFVEYGAALPGYSAEMLLETLNSLDNLSQTDYDKILEGQRSFLLDHAGPCDGKAMERFCSFVSDILSNE